MIENMEEMKHNNNDVIMSHNELNELNELNESQ